MWLLFLFRYFFIILVIFLFASSATVKNSSATVKNIGIKSMAKKQETYPVKEQFGMKNTGSLIDFKVEKYSLENGMTVLLHQDQNIPQVYHQLLVKTGSKDEEEGKTGLAHLFEHMMFRGTNKYTGEEYEERLASIGATNNAFTSRDYTAYEITLPSHKLEMVLEMETERLKSLRLTQSNLDKEVEVVKEERREQTDNNPNEIFEPMMNLIFKTHSYGRPIIGWMQDLEKMSLEDCKEFYHSHYAPNNSILVLAGDFEIEKARKWIQKYYGSLKPSQLKKKSFPEEALQTKQRKVTLKRAVQAPTLAFAYRGPKAGEHEAYSLEVLNRILSNGESSRLHQSLVYKQKLALSVGGFYYTLKEDGIFLIFIRLVPGGSLKKAKQLFLSEINKVISLEVSKKELLKSVRSIMNDYVSSVKTLSGKANSLSLNEAYFNDYRELFKDLDRYKKVTLNTIKAAANHYLSSHKVSIVELLPL